MGKAKIAVTIDDKTVQQIDRLVEEQVYSSRSQAIESAMKEKLERLRKTRLAIESAKLDKEEEKALSEEGMAEDVRNWPEYEPGSVKGSGERGTMAILCQRLAALPGANSYFAKLTNDREPYKVRVGRDGCSFRYSVNDRITKTVQFEEIRKALVASVKSESNEFTRAIFESQCEKAALNGPCGFAIVGRALEMLGVARHLGPRKPFLVYRNQAQSLLYSKE